MIYATATSNQYNMNDIFWQIIHWYWGQLPYLSCAMSSCVVCLLDTLVSAICTIIISIAKYLFLWCRTFNSLLNDEEDELQEILWQRFAYLKKSRRDIKTINFQSSSSSCFIIDVCNAWTKHGQTTILLKWIIKC